MPHHTFTALCQTTTARKISASKLVIGLGNCVKTGHKKSTKKSFEGHLPERYPRNYFDDRYAEVMNKKELNFIISTNV